jgi:hypothetical protein
LSKKLTDDQIVSACETASELALDPYYGQLSQDRQNALKRYKGDPDGTEVPGRSQIVTRDLLDTVEWIMPSLARIFLAGDEVGKFSPVGEQDEQQAEDETAVCNWVLMDRNDGYTQLCTAMRDALILRNGYCIGFWRTSTEVEEEEYEGLSMEEAQRIASDPEVTITGAEKTIDPELPQGMNEVWNIQCKRKTADEWLCIEAVPPDEVSVHRKHRMASLEDADFVRWTQHTTVGELRAAGFDVDDDAPADRQATSQSVERDRFSENGAGGSSQDEAMDPARREVVCLYNWIRIDREGTGQQQLYRVVYLEGETEPLKMKDGAVAIIREQVIPVAAFTGVAYPHSHVGTSLHDLVEDLAAIKQALTRQLLDNIYAGNNNRTVVNVDAAVNIDDLLVSRPNGIVRMRGKPLDNIMPLTTPDLSGGILGALSYVDTQKEIRSGVSRLNAGIDANTLNTTASGTQMLQSAGRERIEMIARTLAGGFRDLYRIVHAQLSKYSTKPIQLEINGRWSVIDPRAWAKRTQFSISVGLGTGTPEVQMQKLGMIAQFMDKGQAMGLVGPEEWHNWSEDMLRAAGYRNPRRFVKDPPRDAQGNIQLPPPQPPPQVAMLQMQLASEEKRQQAQLSFEAWKAREEMASKERIAAQNNATKTNVELANNAEAFALEGHVQRQENQRAGSKGLLEAANIAKDLEIHRDHMAGAHVDRAVSLHENNANRADARMMRPPTQRQ